MTIFPVRQYSSHEEVITDYGPILVPRQLNWKIRVLQFGDPTLSDFESNHIQTILVPGFGESGESDKKLRINKALAALFLSVFQEIKSLGLGYPLHSIQTNSYLFRYNTSYMDLLVDRPEYDSIEGEVWEKRELFAIRDRKKDSFDDLVKGALRKRDMLSEHSFGTAVDINTLNNTYGKTARCDLPKAIVDTFQKNGFYWGGYYSKNKDFMHFEYMLDHILGSANVPVAPPEAVPKTPPQNTGPRTTPPPPGKPSAPIPAASVKSLIPGMEFSKDWLERQWQQYQDKKREEEVEEAHDSIQSDSGYFPIGLNLTWHGGIHCRASSDGSVHAMTDGVVVAVRLPDKDPVKLSYGSRNFVLVKHKTPLGNPFWTLYMHLRPVLLKPDDPHMPSVFPWLLKRSLTRVGEGTSNLRKAPDAEQGEVLRELDPGETFDVLDDRTVGAQKWFFVQTKKDDVTGWVAQTSKFELKSEIPGLEDIKAGKVVKLSAPVKRGDCLGFISPAPAGKDPFLHWEVFSNGVVSDKWIQVKDDDALKNDIVCDAVEFKQIMNKSQAVTFFHPLNKDNIREAYRDPKTAAQIRSRTFFFKSEWAVIWDTALDRLKNDYDVEDLAPRLQLYNFWKDAEALGCDLPKGGSVWHYHPTEFIAREYPVPKAVPPENQDSTSNDDFDIDWDFIAKREGTRTKVYVPVDKDDNVLGKSGPTIASGFDLGQINQVEFDAYGFSPSIQNKLSKFVGKIGNSAKNFVDANPCHLTDEEVREVNHKVKPHYAEKAESFYNDKLPVNGKRFKSLSREIQTSFVSVYFQYGTAKILRGKLIDEDLVGAVDTLLHFTTKSSPVRKKGTNEVTEVMQYLPRRVYEARYLQRGIPNPDEATKAQLLIKEQEDVWFAASGEVLNDF
jgi:hypothetical protein